MSGKIGQNDVQAFLDRALPKAGMQVWRKENGGVPQFIETGPDRNDEMEYLRKALKILVMNAPRYAVADRVTVGVSNDIRRPEATVKAWWVDSVRHLEDPTKVDVANEIAIFKTEDAYDHYVKWAKARNEKVWPIKKWRKNFKILTDQAGYSQSKAIGATGQFWKEFTLRLSK